VKDFHQLTNRGQAMRLRQMALAALERYDLKVSRVRLITNDFNGIFRVDAEDREKYVLRVALPESQRDLNDIRSEMMWLAALSRDTDLGVPQPVATRDGDWATTVAVAGVPEARHCAVFGWVPGPDLADRPSLENLAKMGELAAQLHNHALSWTPPESFCAKTSDSVFPFGEPVVLFEKDFAGLFPPERRDLFQRALDRVEDVISSLYADRSGLRVIHNDLHQWNVKVYRGRLHALDFEDLMWGYPVQDLAITLYYFYFWHPDGQHTAEREAFARGYTHHLPWPEQYPGQIDALIAGRGLNLANFVLMDPNPDWQQEVPPMLNRVERRLRAWMDQG
jgi:Ser/Thr protein kinase RdoA (MazF antagonist)